MRRLFTLAIPMVVLVLAAGTAEATLRVVGTATYNGSTYNLIWDDDNNGRSVVWLDFANGRLSHDAQVAWASGLNNHGTLTYSIDPGYSVSWNGEWRLPATVDRELQQQPPGPVGGSLVQYGFKDSEMGHLYYIDLGNLPYIDSSGNVVPGWGLNNTGPFEHLERWFYWYETPTGTGDHWIFNMDDGGENTSVEWGPSIEYTARALALRDATVVARGGVALFDQSTDTIALSGQLTPGSAATYEARVLFTSAFAGAGLVFNEWTIGSEDKFLGVSPTYLNAYSFGLGDDVLVAGADVNPNRWHHVAYVYDGSQERLYLDGRLIATRSAAGNISNADGSGFVGAIFRDAAISPGFVGYLDTLRISSVARYTGNFFAPPSGDLSGDSNTLLLYNFAEAPGSATVTDLSGNGHTGTLGSGFTGATAPVLTTDPLCLSGVGTATADGVMAAGEWDAAARFDFRANLPGGATTPATVLVMNDATNLYLAVKVALAGPVYSSAAFEFDNDRDGTWPENGDDIVLINTALGFRDGVRTNQSPPCTSGASPGQCGVFDTQLGGTGNGEGRAGNNGAFSVYEFSHPLDSGDVGYDFALAPGSTVGFFMNLALCGDGCGYTYVPSAGPDRLVFGDIVIASAANTGTGSNVGVELDVTLPNGDTTAVALTFDQVGTPGSTTAHASSSGPPPPAGFKLGNPPVYYEIATTATFSGSVRVCIAWTEGQFANENNVRLFHREDSAWVDITDVSSRDTARNTLCGITASLSPFALLEVKYPFTGFFRPVDNPPVVNLVKAGAAVPVKFGLGGNLGLDIFAPGYPRAELVPCETGSAVDDIEVTVTAGGSTLHYDPLAGQYVYVWKTHEAWAGSCRALQVKLTDGEQYTARFSIK